MGDGSGFEVLSGWLAVDVWCLVADLEFGAAVEVGQAARRNHHNQHLRCAASSDRQLPEVLHPPCPYAA